MRFLEERGVGFPIGGAVVPIVVGAILFDLMVGDSRARPDAAAGERACRVAAPDGVAEGSVGAGTGATIGKLRGVASATKGGIGTASVRLSDGTVVGALMAVNAVGDVVDHATGRVLAGARRADGTGFEDQAAYLDLDAHRAGRGGPQQGANTTIGVVATNAPLSKAQATRLAQVAHDGIALAIRPAHTPYDGDAIFALSVGGEDRPPPRMGSLGVAAVQAVAGAIARGVRAAHGLGGIPSVSELGWCR
jgi:L-aminopeptidase/D-esterase-like protein